MQLLCCFCYWFLLVFYWFMPFFVLKMMDFSGTGAMEQPTVQYYNMGACGEENAPGNDWRTADDFPLVAAVETDYTFHAGATGE